MPNNYYYKITSCATQSFLSLDEVKGYLRITHKHEDKLLSSIVAAAIDYAERFLRTNILEKTIELVVERLVDNVINLPVTPASEVKQIFLLNQLSDDYKQLVDAKYYKLINEGHQLVFISMHIPYHLSLKVKYVASSIGTHLADKIIKQGLLLHISELYDQRIILPSTLSSINQIYQGYKKILI